MKLKRALAAIVGSLLVLSGCTSGEQASSPSSFSSAASVEKRIVSLSPTVTETLYQIGAGDQVIAVDKHSNVPYRAPRKEFSGFEPNPQAILAEKPDIVFAAHDDNGLSDALAAAHVELVMLRPAENFNEAYAQIKMIGAKTGHEAAASDLVESMQDRIKKEIAKVPQSVRNQQLKYYHETDPTLYSPQDHTFIGEAYSLFGMKSIAGSGSGFPQLTNEQIIEANPAIIFLSDYGNAGGVEPIFVAARPGWNQIDAVRNNRIIPLDPDLASRWGPRLPELVASIAQAIKSMEAVPAPA